MRQGFPWHTVELEGMFVIEPCHPWWQVKSPNGKPLPDSFRYASNTNDDWLTVEDLKKLELGNTP